MRFIFALLMLTVAAYAQQGGDPRLGWVATLTADDRIVLHSAVEAMADKGDGDPTWPARIESALAAVDGKSPINARMVPFLGNALSHASADPAACDLLHRIDPTAVCVK